MANLALLVDATSVATAADSLARLTTNADKADAAVTKFNRAARSQTEAIIKAGEQAVETQKLVTGQLTIFQKRQVEIWAEEGREFNRVQMQKAREAQDAVDRITRAFGQIGQVAKLQQQRVTEAFGAIAQAARIQQSIFSSRQVADANALVNALRGVAAAAKEQQSIFSSRQVADANALANALRGVAAAAKEQQSIFSSRQVADANAIRTAMGGISDVATHQIKIQRELGAAQTKAAKDAAAAVRQEAQEYAKLSDVIARSKGQTGPQRRMAADVLILKAAMDAGRITIDQYRIAHEGLERGANRSVGAFSRIANSMGGLNRLIGVAAFVALARGISHVGDESVMLDARLRLVTADTKEYAMVSEELNQIATRTRNSIIATANTYIKLKAPLEALGGTQRNNFTITEALNSALLVGGANTREAAAATIQFTQAMSSGVLRGDEFRSLAESAPRLMYALADGMGVARGALRGMAEEGLLPASEVMAALLSQSLKLEAEAARFPDTVGSAFQQVSNQLLITTKSINDATGATSLMASAVKSLIPLIEGFGTVIIKISNFVSEHKTALTALVIGLVAAFAAYAVLPAIIAATSAAITFAAAAAYSSAVGLTTMTGALTLARTALLAFLVSIPVLGWAAAAIGALAAAWVYFNNTAGETDGKLKDNVKTFDDVIRKLDEEARLRDESAAAAKEKAAMDKMLGDKSLTGIQAYINMVNERMKAEGQAAMTSQQIALLTIRLQKKQADNEADAARLRQQGVEQGHQKYIEMMLDLVKINGLLRQNVDLEEARLRVRLAGMNMSQPEIDAIVQITKANKVLEESRKAGIKAAKKEDNFANQIADQKEIIRLTKETGDAELANAMVSAKRAGSTHEQGKQLYYLKQAQDNYVKGLTDEENVIKEIAKQREILLVMQRDNLSLTDATAKVTRDAGDAELARIVEETNALEAKRVAAKKLREETETQVVDRASDLIGSGNAERLKVDLDVEGMSELKKLFDMTNDLQKSFASFGPKTKKAFELMGKASDTFAIAATQNAEDSFSTYVTGAGYALQGLQKFTKEGSDEYKALGIAMQALQVIQAVSAVLTQGTGDPYTAFARMAAMAAAVASLGVSIAGSFGGGSDTEAADRQAMNGTGTVFGDATAKSESMSKALEYLRDNSRVDLKYTSGMLHHLENIDSGIAGLANVLIRANIANGNLGGSSFQAGATGVGGFLNDASLLMHKVTGVISGTYISNIVGNQLQKIGGPLGMLGSMMSMPFNAITKLTSAVTNALFGGKKSLSDAGLRIGGTMSNLSASAYQVIKTSGGLFGSSSKSTKHSALDAQTLDQIQKVLLNIGDVIVQSAGMLGMSVAEAQAIVDNAKIDIGKISLKGLKGDEIQTALQNAFGAFGDRLAMLVVDDLTAFQRVGEGYFETLIRVASGIEQAQAALEGFGIAAINFADIINTQGDVGVEILRQSIVASETTSVATIVNSAVATVAGKTVAQAQSIIAEQVAALTAAGATNIQVGGLNTASTTTTNPLAVMLNSTLSALGLSISNLGNTVTQVVGDVTITYDTLQSSLTGIGEIINNASVETVSDMVDLVNVLFALRDAVIATGNGFADVTLAMIKGAGGVEGLQSGLDEFFENYLTDQERAAELTRRMTESLAKLGLQLPEGIDGFKRLVQGIDTSTAAGQEMFGAVIALTPEFSALQDALEAANGGVSDLVQSLYDLRDAAAQAQAQQAAPDVQLAAVRQQFAMQSALAAQGDAGAAALLPELGKRLMEMSLRFASTQTEYIRDLINVQVGAQSAADAFTGVPAFAAGGMHMGGLAMVGEDGPELVNMGPSRVYNASQTASMFDLTDLLKEMSDMRGELNRGFYAVAKNTQTSADYMRRWDDGDRVKVHIEQDSGETVAVS